MIGAPTTVKEYFRKKYPHRRPSEGIYAIPYFMQAQNVLYEGTSRF